MATGDLHTKFREDRFQRYARGQTDKLMSILCSLRGRSNKLTNALA